MIYVLLLLLILVLVFGPRYWIQTTLKRYGSPRKDLQGTGGELAQHLIERFNLDGVEVVRGGDGEDYYDPEAKKISLSPQHYDGQSIAAVAVAAHETGHALQHKEEHPEFMLRQKRIRTAMVIERFSAMALLITPLIFALTRVPHAMLLTALIGITGMLANIWVQMKNLPIEMDASFNKALPILEGDYLQQSDLVGARKVLKAAAYTYVAAAFASLLNLGRWLMILRR